ncbi:MAG TPA: 4Fe-4S binding protein [Kofleriaceae bacterium]|nr:4Fe-4S binding protein [Kofleriaceae bacterium]
MAYVITQKCAGVCDMACVDVCPCDCIAGPPGVRMFIDPDECIDCGACLPVCPADAIVHDGDAAPADTEENARFFARREGDL